MNQIISTNTFTRVKTPPPNEINRLARRCFTYEAIPGRFYQFKNGSHMRVVTASNGRSGMFRRCDESGNIIPRQRRSKKLRLLIRRTQQNITALRTTLRDLA
jgi:hypothetical protein